MIETQPDNVYVFPQSDMELNINTNTKTKSYNKSIYPVNIKIKTDNIAFDITAQYNKTEYNMCKYVNYIYKFPISSINNPDTILARVFESYHEQVCYQILLPLMRPNINYYIISDNPDIIVAQYIKNNLSIDFNIFVDIINTSKYTHAAIEKCNQYGIPYNLINTSDNDYILNRKNSNNDIVIINYSYYIPRLICFRGLQQFYFLCPYIILGLKNININGVMVIYLSTILTKIEYQFYRYLSLFFNKISMMPLNHYFLGDIFNMHLMVCEGYKGGINFSYLYEINKTIYKNPNGYEAYMLPDTKLLKKIDNKYEKNYIKYLPNKQMITDGSYIYITNLFNFKTLPNELNNFKSYQKKFYIQHINSMALMYILLNGSSKTYPPQPDICEILKYYAIIYGKINKLEFTDKYKILSLIQYVSLLTDLYINLPRKHIYEFDIITPYETYIKFEAIVSDYKTVKTNIKYINKILSYDYNEKFNELLQWHKKNRVKQIQINSKYVSSSWYCIYDILKKTKLLELYKNPKTFHICETPGNFVHILKHIEYRFTYNINTLKDGLVDEYRYMEPMDVDFGPDNTGSITKKENIKYYYDKYKDCDILFGDARWIKSDIGKKIMLMQLYYALLFPRTGGSFMVRLNILCIDNNILTVIALLKQQYKQLFVARADYNIISSDIYIIGIDKTSFTQYDIDIILDCMVNTKYQPVKYVNQQTINLLMEYINNIVRHIIIDIQYYQFMAKYPIYFEDKKSLETYIKKQTNTY